MGNNTISQIHQAHRHESGFGVLGRHRVKEISVTGTLARILKQGMLGYWV